MRESEAEHLLELLKETYEGPLELEVWNLERRGPRFHFQQGEHPYFVVGYRPDNGGSDSVQAAEHSRQEILVWDDRGRKITIQRTRTRRLVEEARMRESELYIYDTRQREFVPASRFRLPPDPS